MRGKIIFILLLLQAGLLGCNNNVSEIGSSLFTNTLFNINYVDSATVHVSTVRTDSVVTSNINRLLVGYYDDDKLGPVSAKGIFQVGLGSATSLDRHSTEFIGLRLYLKRDGYYYYDTTQLQTIAVHQLTKGIRLYNGYRYNTTPASINPIPLGKLSFYPKPHSKDSLEVALPDELGMELLTMAQNNDIRVSSTDEFVKYFKGLALLADSTVSRGMIGFTTKAEMRLYYRDLNAPNTSPNSQIKHISFTIGSNVRFNKNYSDRSGTVLHGLNHKNETISSNLTNHEAYLQAGTGLSVRIELPYLRDFLINDNNFLVTRAILEVMPLLTGTAQSPPPPNLSIYRVDAQNRLLSAAAQGAPLIKDLELGQNTRYSADITAFVNSQIHTELANQNAMLLIMDNSSLTSTVNRVYIGDKKNQYALKVKLFYISLSNQ